MLTQVLFTRLQLEEVRLPLLQRGRPALRRRVHPQLRQHPGPGRRQHRHSPHFRHAALLLHETLRLQHRQQGLDREVRQRRQ